MRIGLTYDLREDYAGRGLPEEALAEFDSPETIAGLEAALTANGTPAAADARSTSSASASETSPHWSPPICQHPSPTSETGTPQNERIFMERLREGRPRLRRGFEAATESRPTFITSGR